MASMKCRPFVALLALALVVGVPRAARADADAALATIFAPNVKPFVKFGQRKLAITDVRVVDGTGAPAREHQTVLIEDGKIVASGASASTSVPSDATKSTARERHSRRVSSAPTTISTT